MPSNHIDAITSALTFTSVNKPTYQDKFWEVCQAILEWSKNMACVFSSGWILCLDELMSFWHSCWTSLGFLCFVLTSHIHLEMNNTQHGVACLV
jgi:hypothetical protein